MDGQDSIGIPILCEELRRLAQTFHLSFSWNFRGPWNGARISAEIHTAPKSPLREFGSGTARFHVKARCSPTALNIHQ